MRTRMGKSTMDILVKSISCLPFILTVSGVFGSNPCDPGWYGELCDKRCSAKCLSHSDNNIYCEKHYGACLLGCVPGWYNENCIIPCSTNCIGDMCNQQTGQCTKGCKGNYRGSLCDVPEVTRNDPPPRHDPPPSYPQTIDANQRVIARIGMACAISFFVLLFAATTIFLLVRYISRKKRQVSRLNENTGRSFSNEERYRTTESVRLSRMGTETKQLMGR